jgi:hypothetical protein
MTTKDTRIVLRTDGADDPIAEHPDQPADYRHTDGTVWTWHQRWRVVGGVPLRLYDRVTLRGGWADSTPTFPE